MTIKKNDKNVFELLQSQQYVTEEQYYAALCSMNIANFSNFGKALKEFGKKYEIK